MSEYDLKKSEKIGQLYPVLVDAKGNVIDGFHRLEVDPKWRREKIPEIDTEEKLLVARCVANWHRRQVTREEKEEWINGLAKIYKAKGMKVLDEDGKNQIKLHISEATGLHPDSVLLLLDEKFKAPNPVPLEKRHPVLSASTAIEHDMGKEYVERHRKEVEQELRPKIESEIKEELSRDAEFIREAIEKAPDILPALPKSTIERAKNVVEPLTKEMGVKEGIVYTVGEYECPNCKKHYWIRCNGKRDWVE
jgi:hypothetical protein